jgi:transposase InsO family protein
LLALVALGLVYRLRPDWLAVELRQATREYGQSAERVSRLTTRAVVVFEQALAALTQRGRPPRRRELDEATAELSLTRALLAVTTAILAHVSLRGRVVRDLIVGAWQRLAPEPGMTQARFCAALSLPTRTLREWLAHAPAAGSPPVAPPCSPPPPRRPRARPPRRGRFGFDVTLPNTQIGADTTDLSAFGVPLKLIAAQDIGGRDERLFDAVLVDDHESAELVTQVLTEALIDRAGAQVVTDQGSPYMAAQTREALAALDVEHAPQREGDPLGKSTVERAFRTLKDIARPLLKLTDHMASDSPWLRHPELAKGVTKLLVTALLRAYQHGARAAREACAARGGVEPETLSRLAEESREHARADERSRRQLLSHLHEVFHLPRSKQSFVNSFYRYPIHVLREAERAFRAQVHRDDIRDRESYFAALVRGAHDDFRRTRARVRHDRAEQARDAQAQAHVDATRAAWNADPATWLRHALHLLAMQWRTDQGGLLFHGAGLGLGWMRAALRLLVASLGAATASDVTEGILQTFRLTHIDTLTPKGVAAIEALVRDHFQPAPRRDPKKDLAPLNVSAILRVTGRNQRPPQSEPLRI